MKHKQTVGSQTTDKQSAGSQTAGNQTADNQTSTQAHRKSNVVYVLFTLCVLWLLLTWSAMSAAHTLPADHGTININKDKAYVVLSLPVHLFTGVDDDNDGKLSRAELNTHRQAISKQITSGFTFYNENTANSSTKHSENHSTNRLTNNQAVYMKTISVSVISDADYHSSHSHHGHDNHHHSHDNTGDTVTFLGIAHFPNTVTQLRVQSDFFKQAPLSYTFKLFAKNSTHYATKSPADKNNKDTSNKAATPKKAKRDMVLLTAKQSTAYFFTHPKTKTSSYIWLGFTHILVGLDHLLFLLMVMLLSPTTKRLIISLTLFTLAHSVSLLFSHFGWLTLHAQVVSMLVEPLIAFSIVLTAALAYKQLKQPVAENTEAYWYYPIMFSFGLIHGCGFAASLTLDGLAPTAALWSLLGFNLGIELGQLLFVSVVALLAVAFVKITKRNITPIKLGITVLAGVVGMGFVISRVLLGS